MGEYKHSPGYIVVVVLSFLVLVFTLVMNAMAGSSVEPFFYNNTGAVSDIYYTDITPAGATFSIWGVIYTWQVLWWAYVFSTLCRPGIDGYMYKSPTLLPASVFVVYIANNGCNIGWLVLWDRSVSNTTLLIPALVVIAMLPITAFWCIFLSARALDKWTPTLQQHGLMREVWMVRFMFQNGIAFYGTWTVIATLLNTAMVVRYNGLQDIYVAGSISLAILSALVVIYFALDMFLLDRYVRYLFAPYCTLVWGLGGVVGKNYPVSAVNALLPGSDRNPYWEIVLLSVSAVALIVKIIVLIWRHCKKPMNVVEITDSKDDLKVNGHNGGSALYNPSFEKTDLNL